jgi:poly-gamma-glutamate capsule biosynthesis protein CapA/YwtB (metallophosphatase superfamily)
MVQRRPRRKRHPRPIKPVPVVLIVAIFAIDAFLLRLTWGGDGANPSSPPLFGTRPTSPPVTEPSLEPPPPEPFTIAATGDVLIHQPVADQAAAYGSPYDFRPMFEEIRPFIEPVDLAICHVETPLSWTNTELSSYPLFNAPRQVGEALADTGYDACSTASNHALDQGFEGIESTLRVLDRFGIEHAGTAKTPGSDSTHVDVNGNSVALLSYTYGTNGIPPPPDKPWSVNIIEPQKILEDAQQQEAGGADFIVVSLHWGLEYQAELTQQQLSVARRLARAGTVDLIIGHHAHVVQPIRKIKDLYVIFGLGNILSNQRAGVTSTCCPAETQDGLIVEVDVSAVEGELQATSVRYRPTWVDPEGFQVVPVAEELQNGGEFPTDALRASWERTMATLRGSSPLVSPAVPLP